MIKILKIGIGSLIVGGVAGVTTGITLKAIKKDHKEIVYSDSFITAVNAANEFLQTNVQDDKFQNGFGLPMLSFNIKGKTFLNNFASLFNEKTEFKELTTDDSKTKLKKAKLRLLNIGQGVGVTGIYLRYHDSKSTQIIKNPKLDIPFEYAAEKITDLNYNSPNKFIKNSKTFKSDTEKMLNVPGAVINISGQNKDTLYDIDGKITYSLPKIDSEGNPLKKFILSNDIEHPVLIDPINGGFKKLEDISLDEIKKAIIYQIIKMSYFVDKTMQTVVFSNVDYNDRIKDSTIASFTLDPNNDHNGMYVSVRGQATELAKTILSFDKFHSSVQKIKPLIKSEVDGLSQNDMHFYHAYDSDGQPLGIDKQLLKDSEFQTKPNVGANVPDYLGILVKSVPSTIVNPLNIKRDEFGPILKQVISASGSQISSLSDKHSKDQDFFVKKNEYKPKSKMFSWFKNNKPKKEATDQEALYNYQHLSDVKRHFKYYTDHGFSSLADDGVAGVSGTSLGERFLKMFNYKKSVTNTLLDKIDKFSLFEKNPKAVNQIAPHPLISYKHPFIMGINDAALVQLNMVRNYRTSINTQSQKAFTKKEIIESIFGSNSATDEELYEFLYMTAMLFEENIKSLSGNVAHELSVAGTYSISTAMDDQVLKKLLSDNKVPIGTYSVQNGFINITKDNVQQGTHVIEKIMDILFDDSINNKLQINDLGTKDLIDAKNDKGNNVVNEGSSAKFKTKKISNVLAAQKSDLIKAKQNALLMIQNTQFKRSFINNSHIAQSAQLFSTPSKTLQEEFNKVFKEVYLDKYNWQYDFFKNSSIGKKIDSKKLDILDDYYISGLDKRGVFNARYKSSTIYRKAVNGMPIKSQVYSDMVWNMSKTVSGTSSIFKFDSFDNLKSNNGTQDDKFIQFASFVYLLDKLKISFKIETSGTSAASQKEYEELFGINNIYQYDEITTIGNTSTHIIELKLGSYSDAMENYINKFYSQNIAKNQIDGLKQIYQEIDNAW